MSPAAGAGAVAEKVRTCSRASPESRGGVKAPMESLTTTLQAGGGALGILVGLNTQLMPGAATLTTVRGAACAPEAVPKHPAAAMTAARIVTFTVICFSSKKYC